MAEEGIRLLVDLFVMMVMSVRNSEDQQAKVGNN